MGVLVVEKEKLLLLYNKKTFYLFVDGSVDFAGNHAFFTTSSQDGALKNHQEMLDILVSNASKIKKVRGTCSFPNYKTV